jgi:hypothetical protein
LFLSGVRFPYPVQPFRRLKALTNSEKVFASFLAAE